MSRVLVISPHPDDEAIGVGGTMRWHVNRGDRVQVIFLTSGENGGHGRSPAKTIQTREQEAKNAAAILGVDQVEFWREPDQSVRATRRLAEKLRGKLKAWKPRLVYVPHPGEDHPDHRAANRLVRRAVNGEGDPARKPTVLMYEVWTPMARVDEAVDISRYLKTKLAAIRAYRSQCAVMEFDEAARALNRYRGEMHNWGGGRYAEIFMKLGPL
jgi:LmbE family N-acetylglucosaminyl deacetylase